MVDLVLFEKLVRTYIGNKVKDRAPTEEELLNACAMVRGMLPATDEEVDKVVKKLQAALDVAMDTGIAIAKDYEPWLKARKDQIDFYYWDRYVLYLEEDLQRPASIVSKIDEVSDRIVDLAGDPKAHANLRRRGLVTMHKTKGTSIPSVIVVMEEYFWNEYDFSLLYKPDVRKIEKQVNSQKLIYVACSRAKNNLICLRIITQDERDHFLSFFPQAEKIEFPEERYNGKGE